jgi:hypothetical protein
MTTITIETELKRDPEFEPVPELGEEQTTSDAPLFVGGPTLRKKTPRSISRLLNSFQRASRWFRASFSYLSRTNYHMNYYLARQTEETFIQQGGLEP